MDYGSLYNDILTDCPGVPFPTAIRAISESVRKFCKESSAYRHNVLSTELSYADGLYTIKVPADTQIVTVVSPLTIAGQYSVADPVTGINSTYPLDTKIIYGVNPQWMDVNHPGWREWTDSNEVRYFVMQSTNTFVLAPDSGTNRVANLAIQLILMPTRTATVINDEFGERWFDYLVAGSKFSLLTIPKSRWTNNEMAQYYLAKFDAGISEAKTYAKTAFRQPRFDGVVRVKSYSK